MNVLWLRPDKPENISIGRHRIAELLRERGHSAAVENTTPDDFINVLNRNPDIVVGTTRLGAIIGGWRKLLRRTPLVVDHVDPISQFRRNHGAFATWSVSQGEKVTFRLADHVMVVYDEEMPRVDRHAKAVTKTHLGVDFEKFANPTERSVQRAREMLTEHTDPENKRVIYIGGLEPAYHIPTVVDAMEHLSEWDFVVLGDGSQREMIEAIDRENVHYLGTVSHDLIPGFLHESDVGICLLDDPNTLKMLEYGAARLPAVSMKGDAERRFEGLIEFSDLDPRNVAEAIRSADESAPLDAFQKFTKQYSWRSVADQYEEVLKRVVRKRE